MSSSGPSHGQVSSASLNLAAATFTSAIDSWIPAGWGSKQSDTDRAADFDRALRLAALEGESGHLGVGHPDIGKPRRKGPSLGVLEKRLGKVDNRSARKDVETVVTPRESEDEDDEDSRAKSVGASKRRSNVPDFISGKRKGKGKATNANDRQPAQPLLNLRQPDIELAESEASTPHTPPTAATTSPGGSGDFPFTGPVALTSPQAKRVLDDRLATKRPRDDGDEDVETPSGSVTNDEHGGDAEGTHLDVEEGKMSKSQRRRENRKRAKLQVPLPQ